MKIFALLLALMLVLSGCSLRDAAAKIDRAEEAVEQKVEAAENAVETAVKPSPVPDATVTQEQAVSIALTHAGLTAEAVTNLHAEQDFDDGKAVYEISFRQGAAEYEYEVDATTGDILSFEKGD